MANARVLFGLVAVAAVSVTAGLVGGRWLSPKPAPIPHHVADTTGESSLDAESEPGDAIPVATTIRPKCDPNLTVTVHNIAGVEAFFQSEMRARASGIVRAVPKNIGDHVEAGELLLSLDVPDLEQDVSQRESLIAQRREEVRVAESKLGDVQAAREVVAATIRMRKTEVESARATADLRRKRLDRFRTLAGREAVTPDVVEEQERDYQASAATLAGALVAVEKAEADARSADAAIATARADIALKQSMVRVAERDYDRAVALADYARIRAPFTGIIVRRNVDPGDFVQNATTGASETLISIARTDLVTVVAKLPENIAAFVSRDTDVTMEFDDLPGVTFSARVSRFSPAVQTSDRTIRVEVDLFNGSSADHQKFVGRSIAASVATLATHGPMTLTNLLAASDSLTRVNRKSVSDRFPSKPIISGNVNREPRLIPGMVGSVTLHLQRFAEAFVVPATAVYSRGGKNYLLEVRAGVAHQVPVVVQLTDGKTAKVAVVTKVPDSRGGSREVLRDLTGNEELVANRQLEFPPGKPLKTAPKDW
ncbi:MAG: efflux RND transporter periplasmic adaptor subunit [Gemmataceae bacterium]|nr:efflux RND transporter periplasmic adaptor subunit [Gemmataceae bacterium]